MHRHINLKKKKELKKSAMKEEIGRPVNLFKLKTERQTLEKGEMEQGVG